MNEKKIKCFFCKDLATSSVIIGESKTIVCDKCKQCHENNNWVNSGVFEITSKGVNPNSRFLYKPNKK